MVKLCKTHKWVIHSYLSLLIIGFTTSARLIVSVLKPQKSSTDIVPLPLESVSCGSLKTITEQCPCAHCGNCLTQPAGKIAIELRNSTRNKFRTQKLTSGRPAQLPTTKSVDHQSLGNYFSRPFRAITILFAKWQESFGKKNPDTCWLKKLENIKQASFLDVAHILPLALIRWIVIAPVKRGLLDNPPFTLMIFLLRLKPHLVRRVSRHVSLPGGSISHSLIPLIIFFQTIQHHSTSYKTV